MPNGGNMNNKECIICRRSLNSDNDLCLMCYMEFKAKVATSKLKILEDMQYNHKEPNIGIVPSNEAEGV